MISDCKPSEILLNIQSSAPSTSNLEKAINLIKIHSKFKALLWDKILRRFDRNSWIFFDKTADSLLRVLRERQTELKLNPHDVKWVHANEFQRLFAMKHCDKLPPPKVGDLPRGSILLTSIDRFLTGQRLLNRQFRPKYIVGIIKRLLSLIFTGKPYTHAELVIGKGEIYHLETLKNAQYRCTIKKIDLDKVCYGYRILYPNAERMIDDHKGNLKELSCHDFDELFSKIALEAKTSGLKATATILDMAKLLIRKKRCLAQNPVFWNPEKLSYACSGVICALLSKFGIDVGYQLKKNPENITPGDLIKSEYFYH